MKSIKPGRGPSMMGGLGSLIAVVAGIFWTIGAVSMGAPIMFPLFGVLFIGIGVVQTVYNFKNATGEHRYSEYDIVDSTEESDPLEQRFGYAAQRQQKQVSEQQPDGFCPYCGTPVTGEFAFCPKCGKELPSLR